MAKKEGTSDDKVTRIRASDSKPTAIKKSKAVKTDPNTVPKKPGITKGFFGYFAGAWYELKQVRWPDRKATWSLTAAVLGFSAFFVVFILLLDAGFKFLFEQLLK